MSADVPRLPVVVQAGKYVSVLHDGDGRWYECKVVEVDESQSLVRLHWRGYGKAPDFWLPKTSDKIGHIDDANAVGLAKSVKSGSRKCDESLPAAGDANAAGARELVVLDTPVPAGECCRECSEPINKKCSEPINWLIYSVKCDECGCRSHMRCSGLPEHVLWRALRYDVGYKCRPCTAVKESAAGESVGGEPSLDGMCRAWKIETGVDMDHTFRDEVSSLAGSGGSKPIESEQRRAGADTRPGTDSLRGPNEVYPIKINPI